jgi:hypothetical protein
MDAATLFVIVKAILYCFVIMDEATMIYKVPEPVPVVASDDPGERYRVEQMSLEERFKEYQRKERP